MVMKRLGKQKLDLGSYLIKDGKQNHKIFFLKKIFKKRLFF